MNTQLLPTLTLMLGIVFSFYTYEVSQAVFVDTQQAQVYSSLQGAVQAFLGLGNTAPTGSYSSTTNNTQTHSSFDGTDATFAGSEAEYAQYNGFPDQNYTGTFGDDGSIRQTGAGIQTTDTSSYYGSVQNITQAVTQTGAATTQTNVNAPNATSIVGTNPVLSCLPGTVAAGEPALVFFACGDTSTSATGTGFETGDAVSGKARVYVQDNTTLGVSCDEGTSAECLIEVVNPSLAIIATPSSVARNGTVDISWRGVDVNDCVVRSNRHSSFVRQGIQGDAPSPSISQDTTFTLICETEIGTVQTRTTTVTVR